MTVILATPEPPDERALLRAAGSVYPGGMTGYLTAEAARTDGFTIEHREGEHRFVVLSDDKVVGYAQYTLMGTDGINFDSTFMSPKHRGSGLSTLLVARALDDDIVAGRAVHASCWYVAKYLDAHPDALASGATYAGA